MKPKLHYSIIGLKSGQQHQFFSHYAGWGDKCIKRWIIRSHVIEHHSYCPSLAFVGLSLQGFPTFAIYIAVDYKAFFNRLSGINSLVSRAASRNFSMMSLNPTTCQLFAANNQYMDPCHVIFHVASSTNQWKIMAFSFHSWSVFATFFNFENLAWNQESLVLNWILNLKMIFMVSYHANLGPFYAMALLFHFAKSVIYQHLNVGAQFCRWWSVH